MLGVLLLGSALQLRTLTLDQAVRTAGDNQPTLRSAHAQTLAADAYIGVQRAQLLPAVSATGQTLAQTSPCAGAVVTNQPTPTGTSSPTIQSAQPQFPGPKRLGACWGLRVTGTQLLYDFGQQYGQFRAAKAAAGGQADTELAQKLMVELTVRQTFFTARAQKDLVEVARQTYANQALHLHQTEGFVHAGTHPEIDLATQRTAVANAKVTLIQAENNYETSKAQLNQAMGVEGPTDYDVSNETLAVVPGEDEGTEQLVRRAIPARPEIESLDEQIESQEWAIHAYKGAYGPTIDAQAQLLSGGQNLDALQWNWSTGITFSWPLFQGLFTRYTVRQNEQIKAGLVAQRDTARQGVRLDVEQARLAVRAAKASLDATNEALVSAKDQLRLAEGRYKAGAGGAVELNDAQTALTNAAAQQVQAEFNLSSARALLLKALGKM